MTKIIKGHFINMKIIINDVLEACKNNKFIRSHMGDFEKKLTESDKKLCFTTEAAFRKYFEDKAKVMKFSALKTAIAYPTIWRCYVKSQKRIKKLSKKPT